MRRQSIGRVRLVPPDGIAARRMKGGGGETSVRGRWLRMTSVARSIMVPCAVLAMISREASGVSSRERSLGRFRGTARVRVCCFSSLLTWRRTRDEPGKPQDSIG